ncbi:hypothetical protein [Chromobacterium violaceum]|uniref:DUF2845 domain-containing protein n=1 Tax=Chromobacterium violaceum (strain ATCC 12472 / DSM 30191 / JCM 1249 / CCUG 213 / NBRC 12614 / NCIMB 9131 / NCTC 9757 / MK) TaxID=243365 RepID=Q7NRY6_CHRVO|nr:hypothetical protein [Chromobacterium violaceum]AAQ61303.1 hypothetical protein CV_3641 [Chromobacterium violaceum ATCC 12472]MBP4051872.1 hypothetical protein [Chromobacterium violaceum]SUX88293.1 Uncharacterised protein [Chromobacterium violaceum]
MKKLAWIALLSSGAAHAAPIPFETYIKLHNGMLEAELVSVAGAPDYGSDSNQGRLASGVATVSTTRQLSWLANGQTPYTTVVTLRDGVVVDIKRDKKL